MGWLANRRAKDEDRVIAAIGMLRPSRATGYPISRLAGIHAGRTYVALARLEAAGKITSDWVPNWLPGPYPRRRVYKVAKDGAR